VVDFAGAEYLRGQRHLLLDEGGHPTFEEKIEYLVIG